MRQNIKDANDREENLQNELRAEKQHHLTTMQSFRIMQDKMIQEEK